MKNALNFNPNDSNGVDTKRKRKRGRQNETWGRSVKKEIRDNNWTWGQVKRLTQGKPTWRRPCVLTSTKRT